MTVCALGILGCLSGILLLSLIEFAAAELSPVSLRVLDERHRQGRVALLGDLARNRSQFLLPIQFGTQVLSAILTVLLVFSAQVMGWSYPFIWAILLISLALSIFGQLVPRWLAQKDPEAVLLRLLPLVPGIYRLLFVLSVPLLWLFRSGRRRAEAVSALVQEETTEEEIQAFIGVGQEEGILEAPESRLVKSALEFGSTLVREIMTPRSEIVAIRDDANISKLKELIGSSKHSRIPVYRERLDQVTGVVYVRNLLAYLEAERGSEPITPLVKRVRFVPETKRVAALLKEMQKLSEPLALVVNEYGRVSGLVTIEDLLEEIVGEIYDEDEPQVVRLLEEPGGGHVALGTMEVAELEEALGLHFERSQATTVSGLIVERLGRVPSPGEVGQVEEMRFEIIESNGKRIERIRLWDSVSDPPAPDREA